MAIRYIFLVLSFISMLFLSACGASSPSGSSNTPAPAVNIPAGAAALTMTVNFPQKPAGTGLSGLVSLNTQRLEISVSSGPTYNPAAVIASTSIIAPPGGGAATGTLIIASAPSTVVSIDIVSKDMLGNWIGEVQEVNRVITIGGYISITTTLVEAGQGIDLVALGVASTARPVVYSPDGTSYTIRKVFLKSFKGAAGSTYNMAVESDMASGAVTAIITADSLSGGAIPIIRTTPVASNGVIAGTVTFVNSGSTVGKEYKFSLNFGALNNIPTLMITQAVGGLPAPAPLNTVIIQSWANNVGATPAATAMTHNRLYVGQQGTNTVAVVDTITNTIIATIPVGASPYWITANPSTNRVYVTNLTGNTVSVINTLTNTVVDTVPVGLSPVDIAINPLTNRAYVLNQGASTISVIDINPAASNTVIATLPSSPNSWSIAVDTTTNRLYVGTGTGGFITVIDTLTNASVATIAGVPNPQGIAINPATQKGYVTDVSNGAITVIDTASNAVIGSISTGAGAGLYTVVVNPITNKVYTANYNGTNNVVYVIDALTNTIGVVIPTMTASPLGVAINPVTNMLYAGSNTGSGITVIDTTTNTVVATLPMIGQFVAVIP